MALGLTAYSRADGNVSGEDAKLLATGIQALPKEDRKGASLAVTAVVGGIPVDVETVDTVLTGDAVFLFDPCRVNVVSLTNTQLLGRFVEAEQYVRDPAHYRRDSFYQYLSLLRRTGAEREARARAGECWLTGDVTSVPDMLYRLESGPKGGVIIRGEPGSAAAGEPRSYTDVSVVTASQLQTYLSRQHVKPATFDEVMRDPGKPHLVDIVTAQAVWAMERPPLRKVAPPSLMPNMTACST